MKIDNSILSVIAVRISQYPEDNKPEFLLVGRSNVGKSSFINSLLGRKNYARTSSKPGKTQTLNFYLCNENFYLVDVPGYGYASVDKATQKKFGLMIEEYLKNRKNLKRVFMIIDGRMKATENDLIMYNYLKHYDINVTVVATKYDKIKPKDRDKTFKSVKNSLNLVEGDNLVYFSSITKKGREEIYGIIDSTLSEDEDNEK
ncbi:MAG: ribosome biogenesis GTP-binding protein YihA/YsxC [Bacilli bacterium]|nr:ribosome biogenesis GTP-binding protein YihA/YsxC [Bacilli bacterium]MDD4795090.1 ribosome biogenesis GTP-binding protein YihA/YsxC [Bacilli bacterium]